MKDKKFLVAIIMALTSSIPVISQSLFNECNFILTRTTLIRNEEDPREEWDIPTRKKRSMPILCHIDNETGISLDNHYELPEIQTYTIESANGDTIAIFSDEMEFCTFLLTLRGEYVISLISIECEYRGYVYI